jgi:hypothetical protein
LFKLIHLSLGGFYGNCKIINGAINFRPNPVKDGLKKLSSIAILQHTLEEVMMPKSQISCIFIPDT